ncbi:MAG: hypothetical protein BroJett011_78210 [Chloroflexota bacterium]|nr:hypothetical protein [Chloroflexota bacterium]NOG75309.1 hypothetical protein [Chloroflexota bacterium]GIK43988.1 MAG: hypothetical protein BroJett011_78210 [Chloroflexota bacterium]
MEGGAASDALPQFLEFEFADYVRYKDNWIVWRSLGHVDANGTWVAPVSFTEALRLPAKMLEVFFYLDDLVDKMARQKRRRETKSPQTAGHRKP